MIVIFIWRLRDSFFTEQIGVCSCAGQGYKEYIELLNGDESSSHKFWMLYERMNKDKKKPGVCLEMRRQDVVLYLARLINDDAISYADLDGFSEETIEVVKHLATVVWK